MVLVVDRTAAAATTDARTRLQQPLPSHEERTKNNASSPRNQPREDRPVDETETPDQEGEVDDKPDQPEENDESYRRRVYGNDSPPLGASSSSSCTSSNVRPRQRPGRNLSQLWSDEFQRRRSSIAEALPTTRRGWMQLGAAVGTAIVGYELCLQHHLTSPPTVYGQVSDVNNNNNNDDDSDECVPLGHIYRTLTANPDTSILLRTIQPSLVVGTRGLLSSMAAYMQRGPTATTTTTTTTTSSGMVVPPPPSSPSSPSSPPPPLPRPPGRRTSAASQPSSPQPLSSQPPSPSEAAVGPHPHRFRELVTMPADGAVIALDWQIPSTISPSIALYGPITHPVVLIVHGINNHANFGYVQSLLQACTNRGWMAVGMNLRGAAPGVPLSTPRSYTGAYTGDIRGIIQTLSGRLWSSKQRHPIIPPPSHNNETNQNDTKGSDDAVLFLVGHSLGANLVTKYLGEEGLSGTLPHCVAGGVGLGNPMLMTGLKPHPLFSPIMALGVKKTLIEQLFALQPMALSNPSFRAALQNALTAWHLGDFDRAMAPVLIRNDSTHPFATKIGYDSVNDYWTDASSYRNVPHISVPTLQVVAADDFLIYKAFRGRLHYCLNNPYVMVVETKCGGHLGWQESSPNHNRLGWLGTSWSDVVTCDFIDAVLQDRQYRRQRQRQHIREKGATHFSDIDDGGASPPDVTDASFSSRSVGLDNDIIYATVPRSRL